MAQDIIAQATEIINNVQATETKKTFNAATRGLGFHQFDGNISVKEVIKEIGADFNVREDRLVRMPQEVLDKLLNKESVTITPNQVIVSHKATVHDGLDKTIGIVGKDYGVIQNNSAFDILDMMCNSSVLNTPMQIVSAGLVHETFDPYMQVKLPMNARINGDNSDTQFYVFAHTSHDGTSGLQIRFSPVRVICQNTFMANVSSKLGFTTKHSKNANQRIDFTKPENVERIQEIVSKLNFFQQEYVDQMNSFALAKVTDTDINEFITNIFLDKKELQELARQNNYKFDQVEGLSARTFNIINEFKNNLESGVGQDTNRGTKLWLFNGITNYTSNIVSYGGKNDTELERATKRFDGMLKGTSHKRINLAMDLLTA